MDVSVKKLSEILKIDQNVKVKIIVRIVFVFIRLSYYVKIVKLLDISNNCFITYHFFS